MGWTDPAAHVYAAGEVVTAATLNIVKDNLLALRLGPAGKIRHSTAQSIPTGVNTALIFDTEDFDSGGDHSTATNTSRFVCSEPGLYLIGASVIWTAAISTTIVLRLNGSSFLAQDNGGGQTPVISTAVVLAAGDYVEVVVAQATGSSQTVASSSAPTSPVFWWAFQAG